MSNDFKYLKPDFSAPMSISVVFFLLIYINFIIFFTGLSAFVILLKIKTFITSKNFDQCL